MWPGFTTKLSEGLLVLATTVTFNKDLLHITDTTATTVLTTIMPAFGGGQFSGMTVVVNRSGAAVTTVTTGNVAKAVSIPENQSCVFVFSKLQNTWYPGAIS